VANIRVLPPEVASQIAAGEVVERPSSAVKELIENAIDAGATRCDIAIDAGGITRITVSDDGHGMSEEDARLSIERHATSKLNSVAELFHLTSFGFRGEALPAIASVSRFQLHTRTVQSASGIEVRVEGGQLLGVVPVGCPVGTTVQVSDLFFNVPARRKFLRAVGTESAHASEVVEAAALACTGVTLTLRRDGRQVREYLRVSSRAERVPQLFGTETMACCLGERGPLRVEAYLCRPEQARSGAAGLRILVNGRPVRDRRIAATVAQAYGSVLERGRYPRGVVYLDLPSPLLDVNAHPQKSEVRFADARAVTDALYGILTRSLAGAFGLAVPARRDPPLTSEPYRERAAFARDQHHPASSLSAPDPSPAVTTLDPLPGEASASNGFEAQRTEPVIAVRDSAASPIRPGPNLSWSRLRFIAQLRQTFFLCEGDDGLYILDQHAAAERVTFTRFRRAYQSRAVACQALLFPATLEVSVREADLVEQYSQQIAEVGLDVRVRGPEMLSIHAVPKLLQRASPERLVRDLLSEVSRTGGRGFSDAVDLALATMACHGSLRAGDPASPSAATALLEALDDADFAGYCPHGRPIVTFTSYAELERKVGRR
jgi:DNA mismatch repair protein MutL